MNGLDPGALTAMASPQTVSPPGMLPLSVWETFPATSAQAWTLWKQRTLESVCVCVSEILRWRASSVSDRFMSGVSVRSCESELQLTSVLTRSRLKPAKRQRSESGHSFCVSVCVSHDLKDVKGVFFWGERHCVLDANACVWSEVDLIVPSALIYMSTVFSFSKGSKCGGQQMFLLEWMPRKCVQ